MSIALVILLVLTTLILNLAGNLASYLAEIENEQGAQVSKSSSRGMRMKKNMSNTDSTRVIFATRKNMRSELMRLHGEPVFSSILGLLVGS